METEQKPPTKELAPWQKTLGMAEQKMQLMIDDPKIVKKEMGFALQAMMGSKKLQECTQQSILDAVLNIARTGLTLSPIYKLAYLVPRKGKAVLDISYMGMCKVLVDAGGFKYIEAHVIYTDEVSGNRFKHDVLTGDFYYDPIYPDTEEEQKKRKAYGVLTIATLGDGSRASMFTPRWKIEKSRRISEGASSEWSPWNNFEDEMYKKTAIRLHYKTLPKGRLTEQLESTLALEEQNNPVNFKKPEGSVAIDILTNEDSEEEHENDQTNENQSEDGPKHTVSDELRKRVMDMPIKTKADISRFVDYVNTLTHLHALPEFKKLMLEKVDTFPEERREEIFLQLKQ